MILQTFLHVTSFLSRDGRTQTARLKYKIKFVLYYYIALKKTKKNKPNKKSKIMTFDVSGF